MSWTKWRKIADKNYFYDEQFDHNGAACYEIGLGGPRNGIKHIVYVGETVNEKSRMSQYAKHGSHLAKLIDRHLKVGWCIYYRAQAKETKELAIKMQNNLLHAFKYSWNQKLNN